MINLVIYLSMKYEWNLLLYWIIENFVLPAQKQICNSCIDAFMIKRVGDYYACRDWNEEVYRTGLLNYIWQMPKAQKMIILIVCCGCVRYCVAKSFYHLYTTTLGRTSLREWSRECRKGHHTKENCRCVDEMIDDRLF